MAEPPASDRRAELLELIATKLREHARDGNQCRCGWHVTPLLDEVLRLHQADAVLATVLLATAQINAENIAEATAQYRSQLEDCQQRLLET